MMMRLILCVSLVATVYVQEAMGQQPFLQQEGGLRQQQFQQPSLTLDPLLQSESPLVQQEQFGSLSLQQQSLRSQQEPLFINQPSIQRETARLEQQLQTLRRQQEAFRSRQETQRRVELRRQQESFRSRQEAQRRVELRRQQERERLRLLRLQQESLRRRQETFQQAQLRNTDLLQARAQLVQDQARLRQEQTQLRPGTGQFIPTLDDDRDGPFQDGTYYFTYATGNGILREEGARLTGPLTHEVTGSYSYTAPNGELIIMEYIADENGYRAFPVRPGRPSFVRRPQPIPVPPPYRQPLPQFQGSSLSGRSLTDQNTQRAASNTPVINVFTGGSQSLGRNGLGQNSGSEED